MLLTFDVLKLLKLISSRELHPRNTSSVLFKDDESKCEKSIDFIFRIFPSPPLEKKESNVSQGSEKYISISVLASIVNCCSRSKISFLYLICFMLVLIL